MYEKLHLWSNGLKRYKFSEISKLQAVKNGIYLVFEEGEKYGALDRIVRVGSHPVQNRFYNRLTDHFLEKQRKSILRKHVGRCFLNLVKDPYIATWNLTNKEVAKGALGFHQVDYTKEAEIESKVSAYFNNFSLSVIPCLDNKDRRMGLESKLIATINRSSHQFISPHWLGKSHPDPRISSSGLWNIHGLNGPELITEDDFIFLKVKTKNEQA
jgi:hypothetical protein